MQNSNIKDLPIARLISALAPSILDIGARGGADGEMLSIAWASRIACFEPEADEAESLATAGDARWASFEVLPFAVGGQSGPAMLYVPESPYAASLLQHNAEMIDQFGRSNLHAVRETFPVQTKTLDDLRDAQVIGRADYIKIDVEGAELAILKSGIQTLKDCIAMKVECSFISQRMSQPLTWEVAQFLMEQGFDVMDIDDIHRWRRRSLPAHPYRILSEMEYSRGQVAQCDLILLKSWKNILDTDQALRLVIISAALGFFDYAISGLRARPELSDYVQRNYGFGLEAELRRWSSSSGKRAVRQAIAGRIRGLVPLIRSWAGRLPFSPGRTPY